MNCIFLRSLGQIFAVRMCQMKCSKCTVLHPCSRTTANACENSELVQCYLPSASDLGLPLPALHLAADPRLSTRL